MSGLISSIASAIQTMEGWFPGSVSQRNNNPGNIMDVAYYQATGQFRVKYFPTLAEGQQALQDQISRNIGRGLTLKEFFGGKPGVYAGYAPAGHGGNDPVAYANSVAAAAGIPANAPIQNYLSSADGVDASITNPPADDTTSSWPDLSSLSFTDLSAPVAIAAGLGLALLLAWGGD